MAHPHAKMNALIEAEIGADHESMYSRPTAPCVLNGVVTG
jgi:hypothetical protein